MFRFLIPKKHTSISRLSFKNDCHTHLLPGVDDSRLDIAASRTIITDMASRGIEQIYLTPHVIAGLYPNSNEHLRATFTSFIEELALPDNISSRLNLSAEYMVDEKFHKTVSDADSVKNLLKLANDRVLIEMSYLQPSPQLDEVIFKLSLEGLIPVLAHPERYIFLYDKRHEYDRLAQLGVEFQLNILSASGVYGKESIKSVEYIMQRGLYKHIGTDIHSTNQYQTILASKIDSKIAKYGSEQGLWSLL